MKTTLHFTADKMNAKLATAGREEQWAIDTDKFSNSVGSWFCGDLGGVMDAQTMRDETKRLLALSGK